MRRLRRFKARRAWVNCAVTAWLGFLATACAPAKVDGQGAPRVADVRAELERLYAANTDAFFRRDLPGVMALRAPGFHAVTPDGVRHDRAEMEAMIGGLMNGIREWKTQSLKIDSLTVVGDTAFATVSQHLDRMALRQDGQVHHVETWVTQREIWVREGSRWLMWRVDQLRDQRRLIDGEPR
jgi:Domain of unknown function (DUF4440)